MVWFLHRAAQQSTALTNCCAGADLEQILGWWCQTLSGADKLQAGGKPWSPTEWFDPVNNYKQSGSGDLLSWDISLPHQGYLHQYNDNNNVAPTDRVNLQTQNIDTRRLSLCPNQYDGANDDIFSLHINVYKAMEHVTVSGKCLHTW